MTNIHIKFFLCITLIIFLSFNSLFCYSSSFYSYENFTTEIQKNSSDNEETSRIQNKIYLSKKEKNQKEEVTPSPEIIYLAPSQKNKKNIASYIYSKKDTFNFLV